MPKSIKEQTTHELPIEISPFKLYDLECHIKISLPLSQSNNINSEEIPESQYSQTIHYMEKFFEYFLDVNNYLRHLKSFKLDNSISEDIIAHVINYGWMAVAQITRNQSQDKHEETENNTDKIISIKPFDFEPSLIICMKLFRIFSRLESIASLIGKSQGTKLILAVMKSLPETVRVQVDSAASLANMASVEHNRVSMLEDGCIQQVLENMEKFINLHSVQTELFATLANLCCHDANAKCIIKNGGCRLILKSMKLHPDQTGLHIQAFHAMACLGTIGKETLDQEDFTDIIIKSLEMHEDDMELVSAALHAVGALANSGINLHNFKDSIVETIFRTMRKYFSCQLFQITACFALAHLFFNFSVDAEIVNKSKGVTTVLKTMHAYPYNESLQTTAIFALGSMVMKHECQRIAILENGGIPLILKAMQMNFSDISEDTQTDNPEDENKEGSASTLGVPDAPEPILYRRGNLKIQCSKPLLLQLFGGVALLNLAESTECKTEIIDKGGVHYIFEASQKVKDNPDLWFILYYIFTRFTKCGEDRIVYMKPRGVAELKDLACKSFIDNLLENKVHKWTIIEKIQRLQLPDHITKLMCEFNECSCCGKGCLRTISIRQYEMNRTKNSKMDWLCSTECAKKDENFEKRGLFMFQADDFL